MKTLVVGGTGLLGRQVAAHYQRRGDDVLAIGREGIDLRHPETAERAIAHFSPELVINCAAFTRVDDCESQPQLAMEVNGSGVGHLGRAAAAAGAKLVHISTDYVFDGKSAVPYHEENEVGPRTVYGKSKLEGERQARQFPNSLVLRTSWLFGTGSDNFVTAILGLLDSDRRPLQVVADQHGCPTYAPFLARAICELTDLDASGIVHYCNPDATTWHGFATAIASAAECPAEIEAITTDRMPRPALRPAYSVLSVKRVEGLLGRSVESWREGLESFLEEVR